jgi:tetratricopeptide (TPR) repeat protein
MTGWALARLWWALLVADPTQPLQLTDDEARAHFERAVEAWTDDDLRVAAIELDAAYALEPHPELLYARGQVRRRLGECDVAIELLEAYLAAENDDERKRADAKANIERCRATASPDDPPRSPPAQDVRVRPWHRDPLGLGLSVAGVAVALAGAGFTIAGYDADRGARTAASYGEFRERHGVATRNLRASVALYSIGGALLVAGVIRLAILASRSPRRDVRR